MGHDVSVRCGVPPTDGVFLPRTRLPALIRGAAEGARSPGQLARAARANAWNSPGVEGRPTGGDRGGGPGPRWGRGGGARGRERGHLISLARLVDGGRRAGCRPPAGYSVPYVSLSGIFPPRSHRVLPLVSCEAGGRRRDLLEHAILRLVGHEGIHIPGVEPVLEAGDEGQGGVGRRFGRDHGDSFGCSGSARPIEPSVQATGPSTGRVSRHVAEICADVAS
jgi:hypothetical protein